MSDRPNIQINNTLSAACSTGGHSCDSRGAGKVPVVHFPFFLLWKNNIFNLLKHDRSSGTDEIVINISSNIVDLA